MSNLFTMPLTFLTNASGKPYPGMQAFFYAAGTLASQPVYQDAALTTVHPQPIIANDQGMLPPIYLNPSADFDYRLIVRTQFGSLIPGGDIDGIPRKRIDISGWAPLSVKQTPYLAKGDGVTDDRAAIQAAIDAANTAGGGTVWVPKGTYRLGSSLSVKSNVKLLGEGGATILKWLDSVAVADNMVKLEAVDKAEVEGIHVHGNRGVVSGIQYGIFVSDSTNCSVRACIVEQCSGVGIHVFQCDSCLVQNCHSFSNGYHGVEVEQSRDCAVVGNDLYSNLRNGIYVWEGESTLLGPLGAKGIVLSGNTCHQNSQYGCGVQGPNTEDIMVTGNVFRGNGQYGITIFDQVKGSCVTGNVITGNGFHGIYLWKATYNTVSGNRLHNNSQAANAAYQEIILDGDTSVPSRFNAITGNVIRIDGSIKANYGIKENSVNDGPNIIRDNVCDSGVAGSIAVLQEVSGVTQVNSFLLCKGNLGRESGGGLASSVRQQRGRQTFNGGGSSYSWAHTLTPDEPRFVFVGAGSPDAAAPFSWATNGTNITVTFSSATVAGTNNIILWWYAES